MYRTAVEAGRRYFADTMRCRRHKTLLMQHSTKAVLGGRAEWSSYNEAAFSGKCAAGDAPFLLTNSVTTVCPEAASFASLQQANIACHSALAKTKKRTFSNGSGILRQTCRRQRTISSVKPRNNRLPRSSTKRHIHRRWKAVRRAFPPLLVVLS